MNEIQNGVKNKKGDTVKVVLIIVLLILLIASMSFTVYDKFIKKDNTVNNQQTEEKDNTKNDTVTDKNKITFKDVQNDHIDGGVSKSFFETNSGYVRIISDDLNLNIEFYNPTLEFDDEEMELLEEQFKQIQDVAGMETIEDYIYYATMSHCKTMQAASKMFGQSGDIEKLMAD